MFTGIVEEVGIVRQVITGSRSGEIAIQARKVLAGTKIGDSIAVNGVCLTVTGLSSDGFTADVMPETLRRSNLGSLRKGSPVDLERAMAADGRFGGHIVSGHIDGTGRIAQMKRDENAVVVTIAAARELLALVVEKGSIAIDGISLTVASVTDTELTVSIIPHTADETVLLRKAAGDTVNLETDIVGKYVQKLLRLGNAGANEGVGAGNCLEGGASRDSVTMDLLARNGFL
ncbi:MAG: riboflavin synthase [Lachnospiraceae bacterium]|nr:riboflavin synthase [Lachnospiraceae bacterium]